MKMPHKLLEGRREHFTTTKLVMSQNHGAWKMCFQSDEINQTKI